MISAIVACAHNDVIGIKSEQDFPWHLSADMKRFRTLTLGHAVIMGRGNYDHLIKRIGKVLPDRVNIVVTRNHDFKAPDVKVVHSVKEAIQLAPDGFVIGGAEIFTQALPYVDRLYVTEVDLDVSGGDVFFPKISPKEWRETSREPHKADEKNPYDYSFVVYERA